METNDLLPWLVVILGLPPLGRFLDEYHISEKRKKRLRAGMRVLSRRFHLRYLLASSEADGELSIRPLEMIGGMLWLAVLWTAIIVGLAIIRYAPQFWAGVSESPLVTFTDWEFFARPAFHWEFSLEEIAYYLLLYVSLSFGVWLISQAIGMVGEDGVLILLVLPPFGVVYLAVWTLGPLLRKVFGAAATPGKSPVLYFCSLISAITGIVKAIVELL